VGGDFSRVERVDRVEGESFGFRASGSGSERYESNSELTTRNSQLNLLYLGRRHPLKGVEFLEAAVRQLQNSIRSTRLNIELRIVSDAKGEELEKVWAWCDVLVLPTLSENFGLVVAEALERGKRVITTDGAPVWGDGLSRVETCREGEMMVGYGGRLIYLKGYREGTKETRVELLKAAIEVVGDGNLGRVDRVEGGEILNRVERVETCRVGGGW
jgi:glycosyltransferase involved in cell wall biosynthesis